MRKPFIIGIGGVRSNSGKTTIASALLKLLTDKTFIPSAEMEDKKLCSCHLMNLKSIKRWGAIKYTKTDFYSSVIDDPEILNERDKDTQRLIEAGAEEVLWVQSPVEDLHEVMPLVLDRLSHLEGIIIEGNSAIDFVKPDVILLISIRNESEIKASAWNILKNADILIISDDSPLMPFTQGLNNCKTFIIKDFQKNLPIDIIKEIIDYMDKFLNKDKNVYELLIQRSVEKRISCSDARKIAEELGLPYSEVGKVADELKIKIRNCELGCF